MSIIFACPGCSKRYEVSDSLAGKKGQCKVCGFALNVPSPTQAVVDADDEGGYEIEGGLVHREFDHRGTSGAIGQLLFDRGDRVGILVVRKCSNDRFVLKSRDLRLIFRAILGSVALVLGVVWIFGLSNPQGPIRIPFFVLILAFAGVVYGVQYLVQLTRLGYRLAFDQEERSLAIRRFFFWESTWLAEDLGGVVFFVSKARYTPGDYYAQYYNQYCEAFVVDHEGGVVALFDLEYHHHPERIESVAHACLQAAQILDLPIGLEFRGEPLYSEITNAVNVLRAAGATESGDQVPMLRNPIITENSIAFYLGSSVTIILGAYFLFKSLLRLLG